MTSKRLQWKPQNQKYKRRIKLLIRMNHFKKSGENFPMKKMTPAYKLIFCIGRNGSHQMSLSYFKSSNILSDCKHLKWDDETETLSSAFRGENWREAIQLWIRKNRERPEQGGTWPGELWRNTGIHHTQLQPPTKGRLSPYTKFHSFQKPLNCRLACDFTFL